VPSRASLEHVPKKLLIVDDHAAVRAGLAALVAPEPALEVVAAVADADGAIAAAEEHAPHLALVDFHLPGEDGLSVCLRLNGLTPRPRVVLYSAFADDTLAVLAAVAGAHALVAKSSDPERLLGTLHRAARDEPVPTMASPAGMRTVGAALEPEDLPVLGMLMHGTPPDELADALAMSDDWLLARRWAILQRLSPRRNRRTARA
jgi:DNA-binding NarL/FixJ family response regulator